MLRCARVQSEFMVKNLENARLARGGLCHICFGLHNIHYQTQLI